MAYEKKLNQFSFALVPLPSTVWRFLPLIGFGIAALVLANALYRFHDLQADRLWRAAVFWVLLVTAVTVITAIPARRWRAWKYFRVTGEDAAWPTAVLATACVVAVLIGCIEILILNPPRIATEPNYMWGVFDKRWIVALFLSALVVVFLPGIFRRLTLLTLVEASKQAASARAIDRQIFVRSRWWRVWLNGVACLLAGMLLSLIYVGAQFTPAPQADLARAQRTDPHEGVHLGPLQRIWLGATPYTGAKTQYGPGHQLLSYAVMRQAGFTLVGFRLGQVLFNVIGFGLIFALFLFGFGWGLGALSIFCGLFVSPLLIANFFGWGIVFRWTGPIIVGVLLPMVCNGEDRLAKRLAGVICLGAGCGFLAWFSQENLSTSALTAALIGGSAFALGRISLGQTIATFALFLVTELTVCVSLLAATVGIYNLGPALALYFRGGTMVASGLSNTPWSEAVLPWGLPYYVTPYLILAVIAVTLYGGRNSDAELGKSRLCLLGVAAAAGALAPLTMLRSDSSHFIGPSTAVAPLIILTIVYLPGFLVKHVAWREVLRFLLLVAFFLLYPPLPRSSDELGAKAFPHVDAAGRTVKLLQGIWQHAAGPPPNAKILIARRLGFEPAPTGHCCETFEWSDVEQIIRGVHDATIGRAVFVDNIIGWYASYFYFLGDLRPAISSTEPLILLWMESDLLQWQRELRAANVDCLVTSNINGPLSKQVLATFTSYEETMIDAKLKVWVYCRR